jgi:predicted  nucleic acid-binding Zn-ribbon protein
MFAWLSKALLGISPEDLDKLRDELDAELKRRKQCERELAKAQTEWANARTRCNQLESRVSDLRTKVAQCRCRVN